MSKYREPNKPHDVSFDELEVIEKLLESKKLTDRQKEAIKSLVKYYYSTDWATGKWGIRNDKRRNKKRVDICRYGIRCN